MADGYGDSIAAFFKKYREYSGYTQYQLAKLLGYHSQYISNIERGADLRPVACCKRLMRRLDQRRANHLEELIKEAILEDRPKARAK